MKELNEMTKLELQDLRKRIITERNLKIEAAKNAVNEMQHSLLDSDSELRAEAGKMYDLLSNSNISPYELGTIMKKDAMTTQEMLKEYYELIKNQDDEVERALWNLLKANEEQIKGLIEEDSTGFYFHKAFRQQDITESGFTDMAIWLLLQEAPIFWNML